MATYLKLRSDVEIAVRLELSDPTTYSTTPDGTDAHWDRTTMLFWFNKGVQDIRRKRPESNLDDMDVIDFVEYTVANHTADAYSILADNYFNLIVNFICWKLLSQDNVDEHSATKSDRYQSVYYGGI